MRIKFTDRNEMKNYILYSLGTLVSLIGSVFHTFVMSLYILEQTESGIFFSVNLAISVLPVILVMPLAGLLADKADKKRIIVGMDCLSGLLLTGVYFYMGSNDLTLPAIYMTTLLLSLFSSVLDTAFSAARVNLVSEERLVLLNSTSDIISSATRIIGPLAGGMLFAVVDIRCFILINGVSYLLSALSELFIQFDYNPSGTVSTKVRVIKDLADGYRYIIKRQDLQRVLGIFLVINLALSLSVIVPLPFVVNQVLDLGSGNYGIIQAGFSAGIILGAFIAPVVIQRSSYSRIFKTSLTVFALIILAFGAVLLLGQDRLETWGYVACFTVVMALAGISVSSIDIPFITFLQTETDRSYLGRVIGITMSVAKVTTPISYILSGFLLEHVRAEAVILAGTLLLAGYRLIQGRGAPAQASRNDKEAA